MDIFSFDQPRGTKQARKPKLNILHLIHATKGSAVLDLATNMLLVLSPEDECYKVSTGVYSPSTSGIVRIILGRIGITSQRFIVHSDIVNGVSRKKLKVWITWKKR